MDFERFRALAVDPSLSEHERIGFPDAFREGYADAIWRDIVYKLPALARRDARVLDVGCGCGPLPKMLIASAESLGQQVTLIDHAEMLDQLPTSEAATKLAGRFPQVLTDEEVGDGFDAILIYSVLQIVILDDNPFAFLDGALRGLRPGGRLLIGDIPNASKLRRFLSSAAGRAFHRAYMRTDSDPEPQVFGLLADRIDDAMVLGLMMRARAAGFDAYVTPQPDDLPLSNRREDLLILRP
ncbi:MAG: class I SAM-dependent methyltransferase [Phenylobacterium sp.]|nr:MAG: class I SAM-dependent methyltransferase [Phenylobacterium sp.]